MLNLIQKFFKKDISNRALLRKTFAEEFFARDEHAWITDLGARGHFEKLFSHLPAGLLETMLTVHPVNFVPSSQFKNTNLCANTVVVFPEFQKLLATNKKSAVAYLAHELAFLLYELEEGSRDPLMAEVEADKFVCDLGLTFELEELLLMLDETIEKRLRLTYLTINHFTRDQN